MARICLLYAGLDKGAYANSLIISDPADLALRHYAPYLRIALTPIVPYYGQTIAILIDKHRRCAMRRSTLVQLTVGIYVAALMVLAVMLPSEAQVRRLIFASAGTNESNRFWTIGRPSHLQFDPFLETLLDVDPETGT